MLFRYLLCLGLLLLTPLLPAQTPAAPVVDVTPVGPPDKKDTLRALLTTRDGVRKALDEQRKRLQSETSDSAKREAQQQIDVLEKRRQEVERDFAVLVTGLQAPEVRHEKVGNAPAPALQDEIGQLLTPIFSDLRKVTQKPRAIQEFEDELSLLNDQAEQAKRAIAEIDKLLAEIKAAKSTDTTLRTALNDTRKSWQGRMDEGKSRMAAIQHQLAEIKTTGVDFWTDLGSQVKRFVFIRGTNILLALLVFLIVFFGLRTAYSYALKVLPVRKYQRLSFTLRILDVAHEGGSLLLGLAAALLVLYARGDWLLGGLSLLAFGGLLMTAKTGIARHLEQLQFLLNLGPVREGERVILQGVPWRVGTIHMFTQLTNPVIGAGLRLPLEALATMTSRPSKLDETWFPCDNHSWILLNGTTLAQVTDITPDRVEICYQGGLRRWIPIAAFIAADVACLSGGFSRTTTFSIHHSHQPRATTEIPEQLQADIRASLLKVMREEELRMLMVELQESSSFSLSYLITADFAGSQAPQYLLLSRLLQRAAVDSSNTHGWSVPAQA